MAKRPERLFEVVPALCKMRPSIGMDRDDRSACEGGGGFDRVIRVHGEIELAPCLRRSAEEQDKARFEPTLRFSHAIEPDRVAVT